jgi:hypothetical protein
MTDHPNKAFNEPQKAIEQSTSTAITKRLRMVSPYALLFTLFVGGAVLSTTFWSSTISKLQSDVRLSQRELERVKDEYAEYRANHPPKDNEITPFGHDVRITVRVGSTASVFDNQLTISVIAIQFEGNTARVDASIGPVSAPIMTMRNAQVGSIITYPHSHSESAKSFEIQLVEVNSVSAAFLVRQLSS